MNADCLEFLRNPIAQMFIEGSEILSMFGSFGAADKFVYEHTYGEVGQFAVCHDF